MTLGNITLYAALRAGSIFMPFVPLRFAYFLASMAGLLGYYLFPIPRRGLVRNLAVVLDRPPNSPIVKSKARAAFQHDVKNWVDTLRIRRASKEQITGNVSHVEGWSYLEDAIKKGQGVVLVVLHLGNIDLVGQYLVAKGCSVTVPVERMSPDRLFQFLLRERRSKGINAVPLEEAPKAMLRALKEGGMVAIAGDRKAGGRGVRVPFFGREAELPRAPVSLARHSGAPVLVGLGIRRPGGDFQAYVTEPVPLQRSEDSALDDRVNMSRLASKMETFIARFPEQWLVFSPVWDEDGSAQVADSMSHLKKARA